MQNSHPKPTGLVIVHGNRMEDLRDLLLDFLQRNPLPPLVPETILVQSNGMKQWLVQSMARQLGISAGLELHLPSAFLWRAYREVLGKDQVPKQMAFDKSPLTWRILRLLETLEIQQQPVFKPLYHYLASSDHPNERRFQLAEKIADLYDQYQTYRADWIQLWSQGLAVLINQAGIQTPLEQNAWQATLWQALQEDLRISGQAQQSRASIHAEFMHHMRQHSVDSQWGLPSRIVVFGVSSLPQQTIEALSIMGQFSQVLLFVNNPCQFYWGDVQDARYWRRNQLMKAHRHAIKQGIALSPLQEDYASFHPLLASWGKQGKDYLQLLNDIDETSNHPHWFERVDVFVEPTEASQLATLQRYVLNLTPVPQTPEQVETDDSICLRSGYSAQREVEMLQDHLLALFDADNSLTPADVMVMMPNVDQFSASIKAVFGRMQSNDPRFIPFNVSDTSLRIEPMMQLLTWLLSLPSAEIGLSDWRSMFEIDGVRAQFDLSEAEVEQLYNLLLQAGVRWGIDADDRSQRHQLPPHLHANTWLFGLERLLLGYATGSGVTAWQAIWPSEGVSGSSSNLLGSLAQWLSAIRVAQALLSQPLTPKLWASYFDELLCLFFAQDESLQSSFWLTRFREGLSNWLLACEVAQFDQPIVLSVAAKAWLDHIDDASPLTGKFMIGGVQFATLMPMRAIPFKVICLIGLNERDYPRQQVKQDFDLMAQANQWRAGDRSRRFDDRYLFLEAILSARKQLYISWTGRSIQDDQALSPSILVAQLIDYCHQLWTPKLPVIQHPLQPFSSRYLDAESNLSSYAVDWLAPNLTNSSSVQWSETLLPEKSIPETLPISALTTLLRYPQKVLLEHRLDIKLFDAKEVAADDEVFNLSSLQLYQLYQQQIDQWIKSDNTEILPWRLSGYLPLSGFADHNDKSLTEASQQLMQNWQTAIEAYPLELEPLSMKLTVMQSRIVGRIKHLYRNDQNETLSLFLLPNNLAGKTGIKAHSLIDAWLHHCLANACQYPLTTQVIAVDNQVCFTPIDAKDAQTWLQDYVKIYQIAWHQPLKVACKSGIEYVKSIQKQKPKASSNAIEADFEEEAHVKALKEAEKAFNSGHYQGEFEQTPSLQRCFNGFEDLQPDFRVLAYQLYGRLVERINLL